MTKIAEMFSKKTSVVVVPAGPEIDVHFKSIIAEDMQSKGDIWLRSNLRIDGFHEGRIRKCEGFTEKVTVLVSSTGKVEGLIEADDVIIDGEVSGVTCAEHNLFIRGTAKGEAYYGDDVDVTGRMHAHLIKRSMQEPKTIEPEPEAVMAPENVHVLHK